MPLSNGSGREDARENLRVFRVGGLDRGRSRNGPQARDDAFDAVVLVDGIGRREVEAALPSIEQALAPALGEASRTAAVYDLGYALASEDV